MHPEQRTLFIDLKELGMEPTAEYSEMWAVLRISDCRRISKMEERCGEAKRGHVERNGTEEARKISCVMKNYWRERHEVKK
jgi:hypothetical protein